MSQFKITRDGGEITKVIRVDAMAEERVEIELNGDKQSFCEFLAWQSFQPTAGEAWDGKQAALGRQFRPNNFLEAHYFSSQDSLLDHCKSHNLYFPGSAVERNELAKPLELETDGPRPWEDLLAGLNLSFNRSCSEVRFCRVLAVGPRNEQEKLFVTEGLKETIDGEMQDEKNDARRLLRAPVHRSFVYCDVSDFSEENPIVQLSIINTLLRIVKDRALWFGSSSETLRTLESMICIGDGYIFVFRSAEDATGFAAVLADLIEGLVAKSQCPEFHFRMGVHCGSVRFFWDDGPGRKNWNYVGEGINDASRVLSAIGRDKDDVVFVSAEVRAEIRKVTEAQHEDRYLSFMQNRGRRKDKHGKMRRVFELDHTGLAFDLQRGDARYQFGRIRPPSLPRS